MAEETEKVVEESVVCCHQREVQVQGGLRYVRYGFVTAQSKKAQ